MAKLIKASTKSGHWYDVQGNPHHTILKKDGSGERATTLADAKKNNWLPSVTSILGCLNKPALEKWKIEQAILTTIGNPKETAESKEYYCKRINQTAFEQVEKAADIGSSIHKAMEFALASQPYNMEFHKYIAPVLEWLKSKDIEIVCREQIVINAEEGFAGTTDLLFRYGKSGFGIIDWKTKKFNKTKPKAYPEQIMQCAAYAATVYGRENLDKVLSANIFISSDNPGEFCVCKHDNLAEMYETFLHACAVWRSLKNYDPRKRL